MPRGGKAGRGRGRGVGGTDGGGSGVVVPPQGVQGVGVAGGVAGAAGLPPSQPLQDSGVGTPDNNDYPCVTCRFPVFSDDVGGIACDDCNQWCHGSQLCTGLPTDFVKEVLKHQGKGIKYSCTKCRLTSVPTVNNDSAGVQDLNASVISLKDCMSQMFNTITSLCVTVKSLEEKVSGNVILSNAGSNNQDVKSAIREEVRELTEREKRKESIIVRGISYTDDFQQRFNSVVSFLWPERTEQITLVDVVPINNALTRAKIKNINVKNELLSRSKNLHGSQFSNIYISRDLTFLQRQELRAKRSRGLAPSVSSVSTVHQGVPSARSSPAVLSVASQGATGYSALGGPQLDPKNSK